MNMYIIEKDSKLVCIHNVQNETDCFIEWFNYKGM